MLNVHIRGTSCSNTAGCSSTLTSTRYNFRKNKTRAMATTQICIIGWYCDSGPRTAARTGFQDSAPKGNATLSADESGGSIHLKQKKAYPGVSARRRRPQDADRARDFYIQFFAPRTEYVRLEGTNRRLQPVHTKLVRASAKRPCNQAVGGW